MKFKSITIQNFRNFGDIELNFSDSDFHNKQIEKPIEIIVTLDISDTANSDCQKLRVQLKGALQMGSVAV